MAYQAPVLEDNRLGLEEKAPIHVADVVRMVEESCFYQSQVATSGDTTLKNNYHGGAMLAPHGTSREMSGNVGTKNRST